MSEKDGKNMSVQSIKRLPYYLKFLKELEEKGNTYVPALVLAEYFDVYEVQVRKDLAAVSSQPGKPRVGFNVHTLINDIEHFLGYDRLKTAVLVGAGHLGSALLSYGEFEHYGLKIIAAFDSNPEVIGQKIHGRTVHAMEELEEYCDKHHAAIGIITTPADYAQQVCDQLVKAGVKGIWNFAHVHLTVPAGVLMQREDMAISLALLSNRLVQEYEDMDLSEVEE